ncbi:MAG: AMP-binding protein, partial [Gemmatimonadales bacterium]|nr:AMP-binding protein [Gemmatimonadales bacterium]
LGSCGRPNPLVDVKLFDSEMREVAIGEPGEICVRGTLVMDGYWKRPEATEEAFRGGWLHTGDVAIKDEEGYLYIVDRTKDMIISGGFNIYPSDIEAVLVRHEAVAEAAVVGVPSDRWGETPIAVIVPNEGFTAVTADEIREWANARLGKTQRIAAAWLASALPRNDIGKVSKRHLRDEYARRAQQVEEAAGPAGAR